MNDFANTIYEWKQMRDACGALDHLQELTRRPQAKHFRDELRYVRDDWVLARCLEAALDSLASPSGGWRTPLAKCKQLLSRNMDAKEQDIPPEMLAKL